MDPIASLLLPGQQVSSSEAALLARVVADTEGTNRIDPDRASPNSPSAIDLATANLYVRAARRAQSLIRELHQAHGPIAGSSHSKVVIVPGAFHRQHKGTGADGARFVEIARELGLQTEVIPLPSLAAMRQNARAIIEYLRNHHGPVILVSLSKGSADVKTAFALRDSAEVFAPVSAWIDISGIIDGTPLIAWLRRHPLNLLGVRLLLALRGQSYRAIGELSDDPGSPLAAPLAMPQHIRHIRAIGFPLVAHLSDGLARRGHRRLAHLGPNDGGGIVLERAVSGASEVLPIWGADHYLRPKWGVTQTFKALLSLLTVRRPT